MQVYDKRDFIAMVNGCLITEFVATDRREAEKWLVATTKTGGFFGIGGKTEVVGWFHTYSRTGRKGYGQVSCDRWPDPTSNMRPDEREYIRQAVGV